MDGRKYYVLCGINCKFESMTKEQILTAIAQAVETGEIKDVDTGFVTKIKEQNRGAALSFWIGTTAEYNALEEKTANCFYICTDDTTGDDLKKSIDELREGINGAIEHTNNLATYEVRLTMEGGKAAPYGTGEKTVEEIKAAAASGRRVIARIYNADGTLYSNKIFEYNEISGQNVKFSLITESANWYVTYKENKTFETQYTKKESVPASVTVTGTGYTECFEWWDGNEENEDRNGLFVTLEGDKVRIADETDVYILGVVTDTAAVTGNVGTDGAAIGTHGTFIVRDDGTSEANDFCKVADGGIVTKSDEDTPYRVLERYDDNRIKIYINNNPSKVEDAVNELSGEIEKTKENIETLQNDMRKAQSQLEGIAENGDTVEQLQRDVETVQSQIEGIVSQLENLTSIVETLEQKIN